MNPLATIRGQDHLTDEQQARVMLAVIYLRKVKELVLQGSDPRGVDRKPHEQVVLYPDRPFAFCFATHGHETRLMDEDEAREFWTASPGRRAVLARLDRDAAARRGAFTRYP
jgi:hypothetical protein